MVTLPCIWFSYRFPHPFDMSALFYGAKQMVICFIVGPEIEGKGGAKVGNVIRIFHIVEFL